MKYLGYHTHDRYLCIMFADTGGIKHYPFSIRKDHCHSYGGEFIVNLGFEGIMSPDNIDKFLREKFNVSDDRQDMPNATSP